MPTLTIPVALVASNPGTFQDWIANGPNTDKGDFSQVGGGIVVFDPATQQSYFLQDTGALPASGITIVSVSVVADVAKSGVGGIKLFLYQGITQHTESSAFSGTGVHGFVSAVNPFTSAAWARSEVFAVQYGILCTATTDFEAALTGVRSGFSVDVSYTTTPPPPTEVDVTGQGGTALGGASTTSTVRQVYGQGGLALGGANSKTFGAGTGPAAELHLNQWGLEAFMLDTTLGEHLG